MRLARRVRACAVPLALALGLGCLAPPAQANLFPDFYLFSDRPAPVPLALGSVLFHFYQEDDRATLAEALYVEARFAQAGQPVPARDQLLLAKGSAALGLGMLQAARGWLDEVRPEALPPLALPRLHLAMARVAFLDGDDARAREMLGRLPPEFAARADVSFLRAELARRAQDLAGMASALAPLPEAHPLWYFGWHNYAVTARGLQAFEPAASAFDRLAETRPDDAASRDIAVRAGLQGALLREEQGDAAGAIARLDRVPVAGSYGRTALAQRAQLALRQDDYRTAAKVFAALAAPADDRWDAERVDALIGVSYIQERTQGGTAALPAYGRAVDALAARVAGLQALQRGLDDHAWLGALADIEASTRGAALPAISEGGLAGEGAPARPAPDWHALDARFAAVDWLAWLAAPDTQRDLLAWRRLGDAQARLGVLGESSFALGEAAQEQEVRVARAARRMRDGAVLARIERIEARLGGDADALRGLRAADVWRDAATRDAALRVLATESERDQLARLQRLAASPVASAAHRARLARLQGVLAYRIETDAAERVWQREKLRRAQLRRLEAIDVRGARIAAAELERSGQRGAAARVAALRTRLGELANVAGELRMARETLLGTGLRGRIAADRRDSERQLAYARLAMARIADAGLQAGAAPSTTAPAAAPAAAPEMAPAAASGAQP